MAMYERNVIATSRSFERRFVKLVPQSRVVLGGSPLVVLDCGACDVKKKKKAKKKGAKAKSTRPDVQRASAAVETAESRSAVAANVAWMLALISTLMAEAIGLVCRWYTAFVEPVELLTVLSAILLLVALVSGLVTLGMIPVVYKLSSLRPPAFITQLAVLAGGLPLAVVLMQYIQGQ